MLPVEVQTGLLRLGEDWSTPPLIQLMVTTPPERVMLVMTGAAALGAIS